MPLSTEIALCKIEGLKVVNGLILKCKDEVQ